MSGARPVSWLPFLLIALALAAGTMGATMASPLFPIYEHSWGIRHSDITVIYVVYMIGVLGAFLFLGRLPGVLGALPVLRIGTALLLTGLMVSAVATGPAMLNAARLVVGVASGLITTAATLGLIEVEPGGVRRAPIVTSSVTMAGFGSGPLVCGLVAQWAPWPLVTPYLVVAVPILAILVGLCRVRVAHVPEGRLSLRPHLDLPGAPALAGFAVAGLAVFTAYALFSLLASLAPSFLMLILPWGGPAVTGSAVAAVLFCSALIQIPFRRLAPRAALTLALGLMTLGVLTLALAMARHSAAAFVLADISIGMGHGLAFMSGVALVNLISTDSTRAGTFATFFCIAYLGTIVPILAVGRLADAIGLGPAVIWFSLIFAVICLVALPAARVALAPARLKPLS